MTVLCRAYASHEEARRSVKAVLDVGVPGEDVHVLSGQPSRDVRDEPVGGFAGAVAPDDPVADFSGEHERKQGMGAFAGDAASQRRGGFGDLDRDVETTYPGGAEHRRVTGQHDLQRLLTDAGLDEVTARADVHALHEGRIVVVVDTGAVDPDAVTERLDDAGR